ncbi:acyltransferase family protein [Streptacidiphilus sp. MAP5-3]|uniref:acyltransferase family protein n=1 Tax=unclassified Streptacidiphilus TaxID=2643834 RepID=UPI0035143915
MTQASSTLQSPPRADHAPADGAKPKASARLGWLDALRGLAALAVVYRHTGPTWVPQLYAFTDRYVDAGTFGVTLFFLVSGYIVPASLERRGDLRTFWIGRFFRIYPLFIAVVVGGLLLPESLQAVAGSWRTNPWQTLGGNSVLLTELLGTANGLKVSWTLSYEMVFYFLVSALFTLRLHRRSAPIALVFGALALAFATTMPVRILSAHGHMETVLVVTLVVVFGAMVCIMTGATLLGRIGALAVGVLGLVLVTMNSGLASFDSMTILATMFSGTVIYRAEHGQIRRWWGVLACVAVITTSLVSGGLYDTYGATWTGPASYCGAIAAAWLLFGLGLLLRNQRIPRFLSWLGTVSYAVYLVHWPVYLCLSKELHQHHLYPRTHLQQAVWGAVFLAIVLATAYAGHRLIELPTQRLGRRLTTWASQRGKARTADLAQAQPTGS